MEELNYTLRTPNSEDLFPAMKIVSKIGLSGIIEKINDQKEKIDNMVKAAAEKEEKVNLRAMGIMIAASAADMIFSKLPECKDELYAFVSSMTGLKVSELKTMSMANFTSIVIDILKNEEFADFFQVLLQLYS